MRNLRIRSLVDQECFRQGLAYERLKGMILEISRKVKVNVSIVEVVITFLEIEK